MTDVLPAIIPKSKELLTEEMKLASKFAKRVQIDICDGQFVPVKTWPYNGVDTEYFEALKSEDEGWPEWEKVDVELHLMVLHPETALEEWIHTGIASCVVHVEAIESPEAFDTIVRMVRDASIALGIALKPHTDPDTLAEYVPHVDFIQVMGSQKLGHHDVELDPRAVELISILHTRYPERIIAIDIGVTPDTIAELVNAGATKIISGGAILNADDPKEMYELLRHADF